MSQWKKTLGVAWVAQFLSVTGFSFAMPFLPLYMKELAEMSEADARFWAGIVTAAAPVTMMVFSAFWGALADRYGRKMMVLRSMFGGALVLALTAAAQNVGQLILCRLLQGALSGTVLASTALVAGATPPRRSGFALGMIQSAVYCGISAGPLIGGVLADDWGYRRAFLIGAALIVTGAFLVTLGVRERFERPDPDVKAERRSLARILLAPGLPVIVLMFVIFRFANTALAPVVPLFVEELHGTPERLNTVIGSIGLVAGLSGALCVAVVARFSDAWGHRRLLMIFILLACAACVGHAQATSVAQLYVLRSLFIAAAAGMMAAMNAIIHNVSEGGDLGRAYGVVWSVGCVGWILGPATGGILAARMGLRAPFLLTAGCQLLALLIVVLFVKSGNDRSNR